MIRLLDVNEITEYLRDYCTLPLCLCVESGCIAATEFTEGGSADYAITFEHPEGPISFGFDRPTNAEYLELDPARMSDDYAANRSMVNVEYGLDASDEPPWAEFDASGAALGTEAMAANLQAWLESPVGDDVLEGLGDALSEYAPGLAIYEALGESERTRFRLRRVNLGGHASSVPPVAFGGDAVEFNDFLRERELPYRLEQAPD